MCVHVPYPAAAMDKAIEAASAAVKGLHLPGFGGSGVHAAVVESGAGSAVSHGMGEVHGAQVREMREAEHHAKGGMGVQEAATAAAGQAQMAEHTVA